MTDGSIFYWNRYIVERKKYYTLCVVIVSTKGLYAFYICQRSTKHFSHISGIVDTLIKFKHELDRIEQKRPSLKNYKSS